MPRKLFRKYLPDAASVREHRWIGRFGALLHHPNLWHLNRDSVAGAVAIGLFAGLVPGPLQMLTAVLLAIPLKRNLPVALLVTFYTNPLTIVPLYVIAYGYGTLLLGGDGGRAHIRHFEMDWTDWIGSMQSLAALGYFAVQAGWRAYVILAWRARAKRRRARRGN